MANSPQARKRARQQASRRLSNMSQRSAMRSSIKRLVKAINSNDGDAAQAAYTNAVSKIDKATSKGLHHKNRAARLKSRLNTRLKSLSA